MPEFHIPVMLREVLSFLQPQRGQTFVDCTIGGGGHAREIVKQLLPNGKLIGIDRDEEALKAASDYLNEFSENVILEKGNFADLGTIVQDMGISAVDGILLDLGVSSRQLESAERGFSFRYDAPLDMRMNRTEAVTARELVNSLSERRLAELIWRLGEERWAKRIAKLIVEGRARRPIETTSQLAAIVRSAIPAAARTRRIDAATRTFQAFRIAVNRELESLQAGLDAAVELLGQGGRACVLSYHSLEDRIVKESFVRYAGKCVCPRSMPVCVCGAEKRIKILTKRPIVASEEEVRANPRARSAKLRAAEKL